ncbi:MAG: Gfo/Idh/MocA family oxidoreductase [Chloroflexi bacterium]|nr:Gfo/Idh/MocA family oxidoreductase [Chloroflexota bacterium]
MPQTELGIGLIGMGWMGQVHARSYYMVRQRFPDAGLKARLIICSDNVAERAEDARERLGFEMATARWQDVIEHPDVQIVNIATPNNLHVDIVRAAAAAGKHIFCEKPVGRGPEETAQIEQLARQAAVLSFVGFNYRWAPMVIHAKQLIDDGALGELTQYRGRFFSMYGSDPLGLLSWRFDRAISGYGVLGDIMAHVTDMALHLCGRVRRLVSNSHSFIGERPLPIPGAGTHYSRGAPEDPKGVVSNEDYVGALVEFENGARGTFEASRSIFGPKNQMAFELNGTKGALNWDFERMNELALYLPGDHRRHDGYMRLVGGDRYPFHGNFNPGDGSGLGYEDMKVIEAFHFLKAVAEGKASAPNFADALAVADVHAAMTRSWSSGGWEEVTSLRGD